MGGGGEEKGRLKKKRRDWGGANRGSLILVTASGVGKKRYMEKPLVGSEVRGKGGSKTREKK